ERGVAEETGYRVAGEALYAMQTSALLMGPVPIGVVVLGLPVDETAVRQLAQVVGGEVCFVADGQWVAGTPAPGSELAGGMEAIGGESRELRAGVQGEGWAILADPREDGRAGEGWRVLAVPLEPVLAPFRRILRALVVAGAAALWLALGVGSLLARGLGAAVIAPAAGRRPSSAAIPSGRNASPAPVTRHRAARGSAGCSTVALGRKSTGSSMTAPAWAVAQKRRSVPPIETTPSASSHSEIAHRNAAYQRTARLPGFSRSTSPVARRL